MRAITQASYGGPQVLELADIPTPQLKDDEILIRVEIRRSMPVTMYS